MAPDNHQDDQTRSFVALTKGTEVDHYRIIEKIGAGGMGEVYLAQDTKLNRKVAIKFLPSHLCQDADCRERFTREVQAAAGLDHPNIAGVYEVGEHNGRPFYSMQLVEGQSLRDVIAGKDLPIERILEIAIQVCEGLQAAHDKGIIHRDIKPSNILLDSHGRVRIVDFGLASIRGSEQLTKTGYTVGTIGYMSPEQVRGQDVDKRSDLFSLGVVLYELISRQNPFKRDSEAATLKAVSDDTPHPVARYRSDMPDGLQAILDKALEKDVKTRYQHADEIGTDLRRLQPGAVSDKRSQRTLWSAIAIAAVALIAWLLIAEPWSTEQAGHKQEKLALAVLHFENLNDPEDSERLGQILQELIITDISALSSIKVISSQRLFDVQKRLGYDDRTKIAKEAAIEVAEKAGAGIMLTGNLIHPGENWIMTCQLVDVKDGTVMKSQRLGGDDLYVMVDDLSDRIRSDLSLPADSGDRVDDSVIEKTTHSMEAYRHYLAGVDHLNVGSLAMAIREFETAIAIDPDFNQAYYKLAFAQWWSEDESSQQGKESIRRILDQGIFSSERDRTLAEGARAMIEYRFSDALAVYEQMTSDYPDDKEVHYVLGLAYSSESSLNRDLAIEAFREAIKLDMTFVLAYRGIYDLYMANRDFVMAMEMANDLMTIEPEELMGYRFLIEAALARGDASQIDLALKQALEHHKTPEELKGLYMHMGLVCNRIRDQIGSERYTRMALQFDPDTTDWRVVAQLGDALFNQGRFSEAKEAYGKGHELNPASVWCLGGLWYIACEERDYEGAIEYAKRLIEMRPQSPRRHGELFESYARAFRLEAADSVLEAGLNAIPSVSGKIELLGAASAVSARILGNRRRAENLLLQALSFDSLEAGSATEKKYDIFNGLSEIYLSWRDYDKSTLYSEMVLAHDSLDTRAMGCQFHSYLYDEAYEQALTVARKMIRLGPQLSDSYSPIIEAYIAMGRYDRADSVLEVAVEVDPMAGAKTGLLTGTAKFYIGAKQLDKAEQMSLRALRCSPQDWRANQTLGLVYELQGRYEEAEERNKMLLELGQGRGYTPDPLSDLMQMGRLKLVQMNYVEAEMWFRKVLEVDNHHPNALRHLGYLLSQRSQYDEARRNAARAMKRDSSFYSYTLMAWILTAGDYDVDLGIDFALLALDRPPEDDPTDAYLSTKPFVPLPQHTLGLAYMKKHEFSVALQYLEQAAKLRPNDSRIAEELQEVRDRLKI